MNKRSTEMHSYDGNYNNSNSQPVAGTELRHQEQNRIFQPIIVR